VLTRLEPYWLSAVSIAATALGLGFLLFIHEFGHFFMAKRAGVKVEVFSMGICHFLLSWTWKGTVYALSWLPLGGYVRMAGQQDLAPPPGHKPLPHEYGAKKPWVRMGIIVAGVTMNFIAGYLCFAAAFLWGREVIPPVMGQFDKDRPGFAEAYAAGLRPGDQVLAVDGDRVFTSMGLRMRVLRIAPGSEADFLVLHPDGSTGHVRLETFEGEARGLSLSVPTTQTPFVDLERRLGFSAERRLVIEPLAKRLKKFPGWRDLFRPGDEILSVNGRSCASEKDLVESLKTCAGQPLELVVGRADGREDPVSLPVSPVYRVGIQHAGASGVMKVEKVLPGKPAEQAGVRAGDQIFLTGPAGERRPVDFQEFTRRVQAAGESGRLLQVVLVGPDGLGRPVALRPLAEDWYPDPAGKSNRSAPQPWGDNPVVREVWPGTMAEAKGLRSGAVLVDVGYKVDPREPVTLSWGSGGREYGPHRLAPARVGPAVSLHLPEQRELRLGLGGALWAGWAETRETLLSTTVILKKMSRRQIGGDAVSGPIGIAQMAYRQAQEGLGHLLWLLGMMGVSLAFLNLLPIPVLDGGHLVFLAYEAVFRKPPSPRVVEVAQYAGLLLIASLFVLVFWNDISRLVRMG